MIIREQYFTEQMTQTVEPYLAERRTERYLDVAPYPTEKRTERYLEREAGRQIYYARYQAEEPKAILLISHGFTETAEKYFELAYYFLKSGFHVYIPEHLGHGRSTRLVEDLSLVHVENFHDYAEDLLAVASLAKKDAPELPLYLYGHSMGGGIAACAAAMEPDAFGRVILSSPMIRPQTGRLPWAAVKAAIFAKLLLGKGRCYLDGHCPFGDEETFADSASTSKTRFDYYQKKRRSEKLYQTSGASNRWLAEAIRMERYLLSEGWKQIQAPVLLFQAERDTFVCGNAQEQFARQIHRQTPGLIKLVRVPGAKHEIYNAGEELLAPYMAKILDFLS